MVPCAFGILWVNKSVKFRRLAIFGLSTLLLIFTASNIALAWMYVRALTHPGCSSVNFSGETFEPGEIWLKTEDGLTLKAWYYPSENGAAILSLGGLGGSLGGNLPPVEALLAAGFGVLQIDGRACANPPANVTLGGNELYDAQAGLEFLLTRSEVDPDKIGAFGFSMGGVTALRLAARHPQIQAVVAEGGYDQLGRHIVKPGKQKPLPKQIFLYTVAAAFWLQTGLDPWSISPLDDIALIAPRPIFLIYGEHEIGSGGGRLQYQAAGEPKSLWVVPGGDHGGNHALDPAEYERRVLEFFDQVLLP